MLPVLNPEFVAASIIKKVKDRAANPSQTLVQIWAGPDWIPPKGLNIEIISERFLPNSSGRLIGLSLPENEIADLAAAGNIRWIGTWPEKFEVNKMDPSKSGVFIEKIAVSDGQLAASIPSFYPVAPGHTLVIPTRIVSDLFELNPGEWTAIWDLVRSEKQRLQHLLSPDGFNVGVNVGQAAGQTIPHAHIHIIPRFEGDHAKARGGVRGIFPEEQNY